MDSIGYCLYGQGSFRVIGMRDRVFEIDIVFHAAAKPTVDIGRSLVDEPKIASRRAHQSLCHTAEADGTAAQFGIDVARQEINLMATGLQSLYKVGGKSGRMADGHA